MARLPAARGFTVGDRRRFTRTLRFDSATLGGTIVAAAAATVASFVALWWCGMQFMGPAGVLLPVLVDGFAITCSAAIVRSQLADSPWRQRVNEWLGLGFALALSVAGNVFHGLHISTGQLPEQLVVAYGVAVPCVIAYGIHVCGRAIATKGGIIDQVLESDQEHVQVDATTPVPAARPTSSSARPAAQPVRSSAPAVPAQQPTTVSAERPAPVVVSARPAAAAVSAAQTTSAQQLVWEACERWAADPAGEARPNAARIQREIDSLGVARSVASVKRDIGAWLAQRQGGLDGPATLQAHPQSAA